MKNQINEKLTSMKLDIMNQSQKGRKKLEVSQTFQNKKGKNNRTKKNCKKQIEYTVSRRELSQAISRENKMLKNS
jgi:hypothetical protein